MPKSKKPKATIPHRMVLSSRNASQRVSPAGPSSHVPAASSNSRPISAVNRPANHVVHRPSSLPNVSNNGSLAPSPLPASAHNAVLDLDEEFLETQIVSGNRFALGIVANLANVNPTPAKAEAPQTEPISRVSRLRRAFAEMGNADLPSSPTEEEATQLATQAVASLPFSQGAVDKLANIYPSGSIAEEAGTQVVGTPAPFSEGVLRQLANVQSGQGLGEEEETQVVPSTAQFSERMAAELGNVDLAQILVTPPAGTDYDDYDEGTTIKDFSQTQRSETSAAEVGAASSEHTTVKSWASGSHTTSMREIVGLPPKPVKSGKLRPAPENLSPAPPRWPCQVTVNHPTCGHTHQTVVHSHICYYYDENPGQRVYRDMTPEQEVLDEWGLPPSGQPPGRTQKATQSQTQFVIEGEEDCYESTSSIILTGESCEVCRPSKLAERKAR